jgi:signal transduction histidine kinase
MVNAGPPALVLGFELASGRRGKTLTAPAEWFRQRPLAARGSSVNIIRQLWRAKWLKMSLMVGPPLLFFAHLGLSMFQLRSLARASSLFHLEYVHQLFQEYLSLELHGELLRLDLANGAQQSAWYLPGDVHSPFISPGGRHYQLNRSALPDTLDAFVRRHQGLVRLIERRGDHDPVYWFRLIDPHGEILFQPFPEPGRWSARSVYPLTQSLGPFSLEIAYQSFGPRQLYAVARQKLNFGAILMLFCLMVLSLALATRTLRNRLVLARQKDFFVSAVSHEFKTPLAIIQVAAETLAGRRYEGAAQRERFFAMIANELARLERLVQKILQFNQMESGRVAVQLQVLDLAELLRKNLDTFRLQAQLEEVRLHCHQQPGAYPVLLDADQLRHVLDNVLDNAFKYRGHSKEIAVELSRQGSQALLQVRDEGLGIAPRELANLGRSYYRVADPQALGIRGTGLGLAIAFSAMKRLGGTMEIASTFRQGTTVTLRFPLHSTEEDPPENHTSG